MAWVHSHVLGSLCEFSSVDAHSHYILNRYVSSKIVGIVVEITDHDEEWDVFKLTTLGQERISLCNNKNNIPHIQHPHCDGIPLDMLYESCKDLVTINHTNSNPRILDFRNQKNG